jgi:hypothetical protein
VFSFGGGINRLLGFTSDEETIIRDGTFFSVSFIQSDSVAQLFDNSNLYLRSNLFSYNAYSNVSGALCDVLEKIPISTDPGMMLFYESSGLFKNLVKEDRIAQVEIRLTDAQNRLVDLNKVDWDVSLLLEFVRREQVI